MLESSSLVRPRQDQVEQGDDGAFVFRSPTRVDGHRRQGFPDNAFADVGSNEKADTTSETISLLEDFIEKNDDDAGGNKLKNQNEDDTEAEVVRGAVESREDVNETGADTEDDREELLGALEGFAVGLQVEVDINDVGACEKLKDHSR